jgi:hypothetical protein
MAMQAPRENLGYVMTFNPEAKAAATRRALRNGFKS